MRTEQLPLAAGRVAALALLLFGPLALAAMLGAIVPAKPGVAGRRLAIDQYRREYFLAAVSWWST